ncbi:MAG: hypothetical protein RIA65_01340 [Woeseia sp.]
MNEQASTMHSDDELLSAFIDGELSTAAADELSERLTLEPALLQRLEALRSSDDATRAVYASLDEQPMPQAVLDLLDVADSRAVGETNNVVAFPARGWRRFAQVPVAIAASVALVAGILVSQVLDDTPEGANAAAALYAQTIPQDSDVHRLLENNLSAEDVSFPDGSAGRVILSFTDVNGDWCRQLAINSVAATVDALACRRSGDWHTEAVSFGPASDGTYQQASGSQSAAMSAVIDRLIGDQAVLDKQQEQQKIADKWQ